MNLRVRDVIKVRNVRILASAKENKDTLLIEDSFFFFFIIRISKKKRAEFGITFSIEMSEKRLRDTRPIEDEKDKSRWVEWEFTCNACKRASKGVVIDRVTEFHVPVCMECLNRTMKGFNSSSK